MRVCARAFPLIEKRNTVVIAHHVDDASDFPLKVRDISFHLYTQVPYAPAAKFAKHIIAVSKQTKEELVSKLKIPEEKIAKST